MQMRRRHALNLVLCCLPFYPALLLNVLILSIEDLIMADNVPSCGTSKDSPLSTAASVTGILTFVYAVLVGILLYIQLGTQIFRDTPKEIREFVASLAKSFGYIRQAAASLSLDELLGPYQLGARDRENDTGPSERVIYMLRERDRILQQARVQVEELADMAIRYSGDTSSRTRQWLQGGRFVIEKEALKRRLQKKDQLMVDIKYL
jgi:hypothetical protein